MEEGTEEQSLEELVRKSREEKIEEARELADDNGFSVEVALSLLIWEEISSMYGRLREMDNDVLEIRDEVVPSGAERIEPFRVEKIIGFLILGILFLLGIIVGGLVL